MYNNVFHLELFVPFCKSHISSIFTDAQVRYSILCIIYGYSYIIVVIGVTYACVIFQTLMLEDSLYEFFAAQDDAKYCK